MDIFASFLKLFGKEYEEIKHVPVSRFWGYFDYIKKFYKTEEELIEDHKQELAKKVDWDSEVKKLKGIKGK